uniref:Uncharacterized protein n=1 Tax=Sphenodon punctatus TaxID=8508 RepID=A0A8D0GLH3_SPHPU
MLVFATPRAKGAEEISLEDLNEHCLSATMSEMGGDSLAINTLQRTFSARIRRREREKSPEQFTRMVRTLPALGDGFLKPAVSVTSNTVPLSLSTTNHPDSEEAHSNMLTEPAVDSEEGNKKEEEDEAEESSTEEDSANESEGRNLGDTTDVLNMTHVMQLNPSDQSLTLSPVQKQKDQKSEDEETEEEEEEEEEELDKEEGGEQEEGQNDLDGQVPEKEEQTSKTPKGDKNKQALSETIEEEKIIQKENKTQQERVSTEAHAENSSSGEVTESNDTTSGGLLKKTKKVTHEFAIQSNLAKNAVK